MSRFIDVIEGQPTGLPHPKPVRIALPSGDVVGCVHWPAEEFLAYGKAEVIGAADPATEIETGYSFDAETGTAAPIIEPRPAAEIRAEAMAGVRAECQRRLAVGFDYDFADARGVHRIGTTERDMAGWDEVTMLAQALINAADTASTIRIATDTGICEVTALEWNAILLAAGAFRQPIWQASFLLQAMDPVPVDYADDAHWPVPA